MDQGVECRPITGFVGYCVGSDGSVWSCLKRGGGFGKKWRRLNPGLFGSPPVMYPGVLLRDGTRSHPRTVHRLVLEAFVGPCPDGMEGCHNDGNPLNNALSNLRWDTRKANMADRGAHGRTHQGSRVSMSKLTEADVVAIRAAHEAGELNTDLAIRYNVSKLTISKIVNRRSWKHI